MQSVISRQQQVLSIHQIIFRYSEVLKIRLSLQARSFEKLLQIIYFD